MTGEAVAKKYFNAHYVSADVKIHINPRSKVEFISKNDRVTIITKMVNFYVSQEEFDEYFDVTEVFNINF